VHFGLNNEAGGNLTAATVVLSYSIIAVICGLSFSQSMRYSFEGEKRNVVPNKTDYCLNKAVV
jgi:hypothetical protein